MPADPLKLDQTGDYALDHFYTRASNKHDHSGNCQTPFPKDVLGEMRRVSDLVPEYGGSMHKLVRDAVVHRLHWLEDQGWEVNVEMLETYEVLCEQERLREWAQMQLSMVEGARSTFDELFQAGAVKQYAEAIRLHERILETVDPSFRPALEKVVLDAKRRIKLLRGGKEDG